MTPQEHSDAISNLRLLASMTGKMIILDKDCETMFRMIADELEKGREEG